MTTVGRSRAPRQGDQCAPSRNWPLDNQPDPPASGRTVALEGTLRPHLGVPGCARGRHRLCGDGDARPAHLHEPAAPGPRRVGCSPCHPDAGRGGRRDLREGRLLRTFAGRRCRSGGSRGDVVLRPGPRYCRRLRFRPRPPSWVRCSATSTVPTSSARSDTRSTAWWNATRISHHCSTSTSRSRGAAPSTRSPGSAPTRSPRPTTARPPRSGRATVVHLASCSATCRPPGRRWPTSTSVPRGTGGPFGISFLRDRFNGVAHGQGITDRGN